MYICPVCKCEFEDEKESRMARHFLKCWRENNPNHKSNTIEPSETIETREVNNDVMNFFKDLQEGAYARGQN